MEYSNNQMWTRRAATTIAFALIFFAGALHSRGVLAVEIEKPAPASLRESFTLHCGSCHGDAKQEAELRLDALSDRQWRDFDLLDQVITRLEDGEMPPEDAKTKLPEALRRQMTTALRSRLSSLEELQLPGTLNRLTRREWCDTLEDLTGLPVEKPCELPIDSTHAMTRLGEHQLLTPLAMRQYQAVAERYVDEVIMAEPVEVKSFTVDLTKVENQVGNTDNEAQPWGITSHNDRTMLTIKSPVKTFADEGVYEFEFDYYFAKGALSKEAMETFLKTGQPPEPATVDRNRHFGAFVTGGEILSEAHTHDLDGKKFHPSGRVKFYRFDEPLAVRLSKDTKTVQFKIRGNGEIRWVVSGVTIRGPLDKSDPPMHAKIFGDVRSDSDLQACKRVLDRLAARLFRRPVDDQLMAPYYQMAAAKYDERANLYAATETCLKAMIVSPYFLFKDLGDGPELEGRMIATRLSYFLSNSAPDERLMTLAAEGKLTDPDVRRAEAERLLSDADKSDRFIRLFTKQWLGLDKFDDFSPNPAYIESRFLIPLRPSIEEQPYAFFSELLRNNLSARNFIHSDFAVWDKKMFQYYNDRKLTGRNQHNTTFEDDDFARVDLSEAPEDVRMRHGGLVSMPVIMCMTTDGETTQPFLRGAWVLKHLFGKDLEPPDTVPSLEINLENVDKPKEILRLHKQDRTCYSCHVKMDYMGLALENYDVLGRYQDNYVFPLIEGNKFKIVTKDPVDSLAETPDGKPVDGIAGLKAHMLGRQDEILRHLIEQLFSYASGREVRYKDREAIDQLMKSANANDYKLRDMILEIVASDSFIQR